MTDLKQKSIDAIIWNLIEKYGVQIIRLILGIILARLLTPKDYGLYGMVTIFITISMVFVNSGFGQAYIRKKDATEEDASSIFYFNLIISFLFYIILWFVAPVISNFYGQPGLIIIIRVFSIVLLTNAMGIIQITKLIKDVNFKTKTIISLFSSLISGVIGIIAALYDYGVWSLVIQGIIGSVLNSIGLWFFYTWRPLYIFKLDSIKSMFSFSSWLLLTSLITAIFDNLYNLIIGKLYPVAHLGYYTNSRQYQTAIIQQPTLAVGAVSFPVFSKLQGDNKALKSSFKKFLQQTMFFLSPIIVILIIISEPLILILLGQKWMPMVPFFQLLLVVGYIYPLILINVQLLNALGKSKLNFRISLFKNLLRVINVIIMYRYGVLYIIFGELIVTLLILFINTFFTNKVIGYRVLNQLKDLLAIFLISILIAYVGFMFTTKISNAYLKILFGVISISSLYLMLSFFFNKTILFEFILNIKNFRK